MDLLPGAVVNLAAYGDFWAYREYTVHAQQLWERVLRHEVVGVGSAESCPSILVYWGASLAILRVDVPVDAETHIEGGTYLVRAAKDLLPVYQPPSLDRALVWGALGKGAPYFLHKPCDGRLTLDSLRSRVVESVELDKELARTDR